MYIFEIYNKKENKNWLIMLKYVLINSFIHKFSNSAIRILDEW
jgi:membrane-bound acyltransferase YfiQ involved in biofilm formation